MAVRDRESRGDVASEAPAHGEEAGGAVDGQSRALALSLHDIEEAVATGFQGPARPLPHGAQIQAAFGEHDLDGVEAHVGGAAADATQALGAEAFASGEQVAFAGEPDLHTAAHEAAHVVQARGAGEQAPAGAGGALTAPGDAREQHADAVADRVVAGESAAALLPGRSDGGAATSTIARKATKTPKPPASPDAAWTELEAQLDGGITTPARIPMLVAMLTEEKREVVLERLDEIEAACTPRQVMSIYDTLGVIAPETVATGLGKGASVRELVPHLRVLSAEELVTIAADATMLGQLRAALPGRVTMHLPQLAMIMAPISTSGPLLRWLVETSTPLQLWQSIRGLTARPEVAATFDAEHLWGWVPQLSGSSLPRWEIGALRDYAAASTDDAAKAALEAVATAGPQPVPAPATDAEQEVATRAAAKDAKDASGELSALIAGKAPLDPSATLALAHRAGAQGVGLAKQAQARKRVTAALGPDEVQRFAAALGFSTGVTIDWVLDTAGVDSGHVAFILEQALGAVSGVFDDDARVTRMHKLFGNRASLLSMIYLNDELVALAGKHAALRTWLLGDGQPRDLLAFAVAGNTAEKMAKACTLIGAHFGFGWVFELTAADAEAGSLRRLALAIPDREAAAFLRSYILPKPAETVGVIDASAPVDPGLLASPAAGMRTAVADDNGYDVTRNIAEMSDAERAAVSGDAALTHQVFATVQGGREPVQVARNLGTPLADLVREIAATPHRVDHAAFRTYVRERPEAEQLEIVADVELARTAQVALGYGPFTTVPALRKPATLAAALTSNPTLVTWIDATTNAVEALGLLGATPQVAEAAAAALEAAGVDLIKHLPAAAHLEAHQKMALMRIGGFATGKKLANAVSGRLTSDSDFKEEHADAVNQTEPLWTALDKLKTAGADAKDVQALCSARPHHEALTLLTDRAHKERLDFLRVHLGASPLTVFPWLASPPPAMFANPAAVDWLLEAEEPIGVLRALAGIPPAIAAVARQLDAATTPATLWLVRLPNGFGLGPADEAALRALFDAVTADATAKKLFHTRFGSTVTGDWSRPEMARLWTMMGILPDRQVDDNGNLAEFRRIEDTGQTHYSPEESAVVIGATTDEARYANQTFQARAALAERLGVDENEVERRVGTTVETQTVAGKVLYRIKESEGDGFADSVLHEVGHAVDQMIGKRASFVYGQAGWKSYGEAELDTWIADMGGWNGGAVDAADQDEIREVFRQRMNSTKAIAGLSDPVGSMVTKDHPLHEAKNQKAFLPRAAAKQSFNYQQPVEHNGRMWIMNHYYQRYMSYDAAIAGLIPLPYAGFAPEEFFAECYVEYYRGYNGTPATEARKGGNLPAWIKTWFDANVDALGHVP